MSLRLNVPKLSRSIPSCAKYDFLRRMINNFPYGIQTSSKLSLLYKLIMIELIPSNYTSITTAINSFAWYFEIHSQTLTFWFFCIWSDMVIADFFECLWLVSIYLRPKSCNKKVLLVFSPFNIISNKGFDFNFF